MSGSSHPPSLGSPGETSQASHRTKSLTRNVHHSIHATLRESSCSFVTSCRIRFESTPPAHQRPSLDRRALKTSLIYIDSRCPSLNSAGEQITLFLHPRKVAAEILSWLLLPTYSAQLSIQTARRRCDDCEFLESNVVRETILAEWDSILPMMGFSRDRLSRKCCFPKGSSAIRWSGPKE